MNRNYFGAYSTRFPFLINRLTGLTLVSVAVSVTALGAANAQQPDSDEFRHLIKQSEKLVRKGSYPEAERLLLQGAELNKADSSVKLRLAFVYLKERRFGDAYDTSFAVAKAEPKNAHAFAVL